MIKVSLLIKTKYRCVVNKYVGNFQQQLFVRVQGSFLK